MRAWIQGRISYVTQGSPAWNAGIRGGDSLVSINGQPVHDMLDYRFLTAETQVVLVIERKGRRYAAFMFKDAVEDLGLEFEEELFGGHMNCRNNCVFCFLQQMPKGLRDTLYVRDDDYRLSLAQGNYITLTNLDDDDTDRICAQRMSPLYVSVHATDPDLRVRMMRNRNAGRIMDQLRRFAESRISLHTQIVFCPGWNDGEYLERTVRDLASLFPRVESIAIVPVGLTKHREGLQPLQPVDSETAAEVIRQCSEWQREFLGRFGTRLVFPSDEFYIRAGVAFPEDEAYEGYPQLEDGIGVSRLFMDEVRELKESGFNVPPGKYVLVTGTLAAPAVAEFAELIGAVKDVDTRVCVVENNFLGAGVTVAGLLAGCDVRDALANISQDETALIPEVCLNEGRFLDDMTVADLMERIDARVVPVPAHPKDAIERLRQAVKTDESPVSCARSSGT